MGGSNKFSDLLSDEKVTEKVFEEFLRNFYRLKQREFSSVGSNHLKWNAKATDAGDLDLLPVMKTDITLRSSHRVIIMDVKYYKNALQEHHGTAKAHSGNLFQLTAYLRTEGNIQTSIRPEGILIYPVGDNSVDASFVIDGYPVRLFTLNLNQDWRNIEHDLLQLIFKAGRTNGHPAREHSTEPNTLHDQLARLAYFPEQSCSHAGLTSAFRGINPIAHKAIRPQ